MSTTRERKRARRRTRGAGTIAQRGKDHWVVRVSFGRDPETGKRVREVIVVRGSKADAERVLREQLNRRDREHYRPTGETRTLLFGTYALDALGRNPNARPGTRERTLKLFRHYTPDRLKAAKLIEVSPGLLAQARDEVANRDSTQSGERLSARTVNLVLSTWGRVLEMAVEEQRLRMNPLRGVKRASEKGKERIGRALSPRETEAVLKAAERDSFWALWVLYLRLGLRPSEALALTWDPISGVDLDGARLTVSRTMTRVDGTWRFDAPKTGKPRSLPLPLPVIVALKSHRARQAEEKMAVYAAGEHYSDHGLVFADSHGYPIAPWVIQKAWKRLLEAAEVATDFRLYDARHTALTRLVEYGLDFRNVADIAGNSAKMIAEVYSHGRNDVQRAALDAIAGQVG